MPAKQTPRAYPVNDSLDDLKSTCETDEGDLTSKLIQLKLGEDDATKVTAALYERVDGVILGHLIFEEYTDDVDAGSRQAIHQTNGEPLVCKGQAYVSAEAKNVIVFREKQP
jgi:hypothetical protein